MSASRKRSTGQHHGDLRNALESAALSLVTEAGPRGFTIAEASRRAGVSVAAPYKHYADRDALLAALVHRGYLTQTRLFAAAVASATDPVDQLAAFASAYVRFATEERALFEVTFAAGLDKSRYPDLETAGAGVLAVLLPPAARLRPSDPHGLVLDVAAAAHGLAVFLLEGVFPAEAAASVQDRAALLARAIATSPS